MPRSIPNHNPFFVWQNRKLIRLFPEDVAFLRIDENYTKLFINDGDVYNYEYYTDKNYQPGEWRYIQQLIAGYKIYEYKNLLKSSKVNGNTTYFTYNFNDAGRITEAISTSSNITTTFKIEYDCH